MLSNFGQLAVNGWTVLWNIWPVFLVAIGLDIVFGRRSILAGFLAAVLVIALLFGVIWYFGSALVGKNLTVDTIEQPFEGQIRLKSCSTFGRVILYSALTDSNNLVEGDLKNYQERIIQQITRFS